MTHSSCLDLSLNQHGEFETEYQEHSLYIGSITWNSFPLLSEGQAVWLSQALAKSHKVKLKAEARPFCKLWERICLQPLRLPSSCQTETHLLAKITPSYLRFTLVLACGFSTLESNPFIGSSINCHTYTPSLLLPPLLSWEIPMFIWYLDLIVWAHSNNPGSSLDLQHPLCPVLKFPVKMNGSVTLPMRPRRQESFRSGHAVMVMNFGLY